ncbi:methylated-DNA--[protein]-cysteine S-methyltransferase [Tenacibaculum maritimum]|uniref:Methylated-DNA--protein-cysteine methyltransferase n=1 Tax=Tenacibaculum maritimum NCIMB 2154 TaxID=1349785 RepID=A0A2H1ED42_9FLAO|nr:methylated-DNA--[protein]-cysteine S-methyltransferase [Tenacibaculum maritimum]MCD9562582.1 methylated-DNA--[protein]-cysteine S-methyltransferase [Tenacibaculum maritimum]MCD9566010.1 methylated-DNA--[protein]-cysteine S-methyltransferase [Tenacibaculum maritimum]MCD9577753.1 methylated-DNA--[protein]-cysteine S-methyltransferase [Tenacibaculum maritimum]MCD9581426.1 methylated-DNA--[protein]-cysteine S-methyltransferase [Tenacibaculum maritimum]MCD9584910.1 methylated-DNA--[protein]-cyst
MEIQTTYYKTPIGFAKITGNKDGIQTVSVLDAIPNTFKTTPKEIAYELQECVTQLDEYFKGKRIQFNLKLNPQGTSFQQRVWKELLNIPYNKTKSYLEQAKSLGDIKAIRAVASANGKNPIWIIIPCHRVIGSDGSLTGYAGGIWRKKWLLAHENPVKQQALF